MKEKNKKILLHACCAICSGHPIKQLRDLGYEPVSYFFNPNIYPDTEFQKRLEAHKKLCEELNCELIVENYNPAIYYEVMEGFENYGEGSIRCKRCFELRLLKTVQKAKELGIDNFTTTLPISPHKNFKLISEIGKFFEGYFKINFLAVNFKKQDGFLKSNKLAKELNLYRQNYCGCKNSMERVMGEFINL